MQLEPSPELCEGRVTPLANKIANMQLNLSTEARLAKMDGVKERRANSRKLSTRSDSSFSTETDECNDRWSYRGSSRATAVRNVVHFTDN